MEEFLDTLGLYKKHVAKDGSCLFRAVSEQIYYTQVHHLKVRDACAQYLERNRSKYENFIDGSFDQYLENLKNPKEWAGQVEMSVMSLLYSRDFLVYREVGKPPCNVTNNGFSDFIVLCYCHGNHYDSVYPKQFLESAAVCQSLVYEVLYKNVFKLGDEVDLAVKKMLHDKAYSKQRRNNILNRESHRESASSSTSKDETDEGQEEKDASLEIRKALEQGIPPFPYKVAKALDPEIYRNVEYDLWNESRKEQIRAEQMVIPDFAPGVKCLVRIEKEQAEPYHAHIQEMSPDKGPVTVFVEELGERRTLPFENLEALPIPAYKVLPWQGVGGKPYRMLGEFLRSSLQGKFKNKQKYSKKTTVKEIPIVLPPYSPGTSAPAAIQFTTNPTFAFQGGSKTYSVSSASTVGNFCITPEEATDSTKPPIVGIPTVQLTTPLPVPEQTVMTPFWNTAPPPPPYPSYQIPGSLKMLGPNTDPKNLDEKNDASPSKSANNDNNCSRTTTFLTCNNSDQLTTRTYNDQTEIDANYSSTPIPCLLPTNHSLPFLQTSEEVLSPASSPTHPLHSSNQPITVYPCPMYSGMLYPYGESVPVNLNAWRSQDPAGSDLPLADLPTVRFFYNLGCDYFHMTSMMQVATPSPYSTWTTYNGNIGYAVGSPCPPVPMPMAISECYDQRRDDIVQRNGSMMSSSTQLISPQPMIVGSPPPPTLSAHAVFYPSPVPQSSTSASPHSRVSSYVLP